MKSTDIPKKMPVPFAVNGTREDLLSQSASGDPTASYSNGFPPITMLDESAGGVPPKGQDFNQIFYELACGSRWSNAGANYQFDSSFASSIGGYPKGCLLQNSTFDGFWLNQVDDNSSDPESSSSSGWVPVNNFGTTTITGLASSSLTLTPLQAAKDRIELNGTLTANINVILPAWVKTWKIQNNCTGNFSLTVKTASGSGVVVPNSSALDVHGTGSYIGNDITYLAGGGTGSTTAAGGRAALGIGTVGTFNTLPISNGGTGATTAADARNNLSLGQMALLNVAPVANGGTGSSTAAQALINLGVSGSLTSSGYMYIGPLLLQWVNNNSTTVGFVGISWPKTFSSVFNVQNTVVKSSGGELNWSNVNSITNSGCNVGCDGAGSFVFAIGT